MFEEAMLIFAIPAIDVSERITTEDLPNKKLVVTF